MNDMLNKFCLFRSLAVAFTLLASILPGKAASYFVDYSAGADVNDGLTTGSAWQHCPGDPEAVGNSAMATLNAGDTVFFKGGVSYVLTTPFTSTLGNPGIALSWSGAAGNPITYDGNSSGAWGSGRAIITDNFSSNYLSAFNASSIANLTFKSFIFMNIGGSNAFPNGNFSPNGVPPKPGYGITASSATNIYIDGCYFGELGYYQNFAPIGYNSLLGNAIAFTACNGLTITNCEFTQVRDPITLGTGNTWNIVIANCNFHDQMEWGITILSVNSYRSNIYIHDCTWTNTDQYYVATANGGQWTGYGGGGPHQNGIMMFNGEGCNGNCALDRSPGDTNVFIYNNQFSTTLGYQGGTTSIWLQDSTSADVYNNVFYLTAANNAIGVSEPATNTIFHVGIYNNTFYCGPPAVVIAGAKINNTNQNLYWTAKATNFIVQIKNNVFSTLNTGNNNAYDYTINCCTNLLKESLTNNVAFDYNCYFSDQTQAGNFVYGFWSPYQNGFDPNGYIKLASALKLGWDRHSVTGMAQFVNAVHISPFNANLQLQTNSPALGAGINLTSLNLPGLAQDKNGNPRSSTGAWTMGAYENPAARPLPPTGLHVTVVQ